MPTEYGETGKDPNWQESNLRSGSAPDPILTDEEVRSHLVEYLKLTPERQRGILRIVRNMEEQGLLRIKTSHLYPDPDAKDRGK